MSNKKSEKIKKDSADLSVGHVSGLKITASFYEFALKTKKHGTQFFTVEPKETGYFGIVVAAIASKHKITVQSLVDNGSLRRISSITVGEFQKEPKPEKPIKVKKAEKAIAEPATA